MKINKLIKTTHQKLSMLTVGLFAGALIISIPTISYAQDTPIKQSAASAKKSSADSVSSKKSSKESASSKSSSIEPTGKATVTHKLGDAYSMDFYLNIVDELYLCSETTDYDSCINKLNKDIDDAMAISKTKYKRQQITINLVDKAYEKIRVAIEEDQEIPVDELNNIVRDYMDEF